MLLDAACAGDSAESGEVLLQGKACACTAGIEHNQQDL